MFFRNPLVLKTISDELIDQILLVGPPRRCRERLDRFRAAGPELPILSARPQGEESAFRAVVEALGPKG